MNERLRGIDELVLATHNKGKVAELAALLEPLGIAVRSGIELDLVEAEETGDTFIANAELKAVAALAATGRPSLADDSGLEVAGLGGAPGIHSARWAGTPRDFGAAMRRVIGELIDCYGSFEAADKRARFTAVLCMAWPDGSVDFYEGHVDGHLIDTPRGSNGFGYDPIFIPDLFDRTFAEMEQGEKQALSHRSQAFDALIAGQASSSKGIANPGL